MISNPSRAREKLARLQRLLADDFALFLHDEAREKIEQLIDRVEVLRIEQANTAWDRDVWLALSEASRLLASRRLRVVNLVLHFEACGFDQGSAIREVIAMAAMPRRQFVKSFHWAVIDDWTALRALRIGDDFLSRRGLDLWLAAREDKPREVFPLCLVEPADLDLAVQHIIKKQERA